MTANTVTLDGMDLHVRQAGEGAPVLLVHGLGGASTSWTPALEALSQDFHAIAPDLPGYGRSAKPEAAYTPAFFVDTLVGLLDELGLADAHVVGSSMGGHVAIELALRHPDRVRRLLTVAPAGVPPADFDGTPALATYRGIVYAETEDEVRQILETIQPEEIEPPEHGREPTEILDYATSPGAEQAFEASLRATAKARRLGPLLDEVAVPHLVAWGTHDPMIPWDVAEPVLAAAETPGLVVFDETGHSPHNQHPTLFGRLAQAFLSGELTPDTMREPLVDVRRLPG